MKNFFKKTKLKVSRWLLQIHHGIKRYLGGFLFALCIIMFMLIACTNMLHRVPIFAYFIEEMKLPIALKVCGKINIYDNNNLVNSLPVDIKIGGYEKRVYSGEEFELVFSATDKEDIPIMLEYQIGNEIIKKIESISYVEKQYTIKCYFEYFE